jgi:cytochrome b involved in lipid metabolism
LVFFLAAGSARPLPPLQKRALHPLLPAGKDATQDFEEIGHSNSARELLNKYYIGEYAVSFFDEGAREKRRCCCSNAARARATTQQQPFCLGRVLLSHTHTHTAACVP